jgi:hypothetical protein
MDHDTHRELGRGLRLLVDVLNVARSSNCWWRGQAQDWPLVPKANREPFCRRDPAMAYFSWARSACRHVALPVSPLDALALAQHHGLATPLLDWTSNPLVALYFAAAGGESRDGAVYTTSPPPMDVLAADPTIEKVGGPRVLTSDLRDKYPWFGYIPRVLNPRIDRQSGLFTYHPWRSKPLEPLHTIRVPADLKTDLLYTLDIMGVNHSTVFPDLDGLSAYVNDSAVSFPQSEPPETANR